jgi:ribosomal protein L11 methyltransferase
VIVIEPGRAFGTGHHGSTAGCLALLERVSSRRPVSDALDIGTGSGILAIAAARLGVRAVLAVDNDPDAVAVAAANTVLNDVADRVRCVVGDTELAAVSSPGQYALVLANLLASAHLGLSRRYRTLVDPGGFLVLGGILENEARGVEHSLGAAGFVETDREVVAGWASLTFTPS